MFVIHDKKTISLKILGRYPANRVSILCEQSFDLIRNLFAIDLTALIRVKQTALSSLGKKKNMLGKATRCLQGRVAQSRMS